MSNKSNKQDVFSFVYFVLLDPCILSFRRGGDQKCPFECMDFSYLELCEGAAVAKHKG